MSVVKRYYSNVLYVRISSVTFQVNQKGEKKLRNGRKKKILSCIYIFGFYVFIFLLVSAFCYYVKPVPVFGYCVSLLYGIFARVRLGVDVFV